MSEQSDVASQNKKDSNCRARYGEEANCESDFLQEFTLFFRDSISL